MTITEKIDAVQTSVFEYDIAALTNDLVGVFSEILESGAIDTRDAAALGKLNTIMGECMSAMQRKDYLLIADKLEYDLKPLTGYQSR